MVEFLPIASAGEGGGHWALAAVLLAVALMLVAAQRLRVPYPLLLVVGGGAFALLPGAPEVELSPELVLVIFLPVLLYAAAFFSSLRDLKAEAAPITALALGLVVVTMGAVGTAAHFVLGLDWPVALVLGAVLSPTDAVAATAIASRTGAPRRVVTIIEGESLVNDASALIVYKFAVAAVTTGAFSLADAGIAFVVGLVGGVLVGLVVGKLSILIRKRIDDTSTEIAVSIAVPFLAYLPAEELGVSAVVAAVTAGIYVGWQAPWLVSPTYRLQAFAVWETIQFLSNAALFVLVGMQLPGVIDELAKADVSGAAIALEGLFVAAVVIATRVAWVMGFVVVTQLIPPLRRLQPVGDAREAVAISWSGMRGAVSLATALAIPLTVDGGGPFPDHSKLILLTYVAILVTLLFQGLSLPLVLSKLGLRDNDSSSADEESYARANAAKAAIENLPEVAREFGVADDLVDRVRSRYEFRRDRHIAAFKGERSDHHESQNSLFVRFSSTMLEIERQALIELRSSGRIGDAAMWRVMRELDLEHERLHN